MSRLGGVATKTTNELVKKNASFETHHRDIEDGVVVLEEVGKGAVRSRVSSDGSSPLSGIGIRRARGDVGGDGVSREEVDRDGGVRPHHCKEKSEERRLSDSRKK